MFNHPLRLPSVLVFAFLLGATSTAHAAFGRDITVTDVRFSSDFDTATVTLSREPGETVHVAYVYYVGESQTSYAAGGGNRVGKTSIFSGFRNRFEEFGGDGTRFRLQFRVCPFDEPYTGKHTYEHCGPEYVTYVTYRSEAPDGPAITNAVVDSDYETITVELDRSMEKGYIQYERWGSGNGYDYSSMQYRADKKKTVTLLGIRQGFVTSGTSGVQSIALRACSEDSDGSSSCGPAYPLTIQWNASASFRDVPAGHPNAEAISYVRSQGIVTGYPDGMFRPDHRINRAEFTKVITLALFGQRMIDMCGTFYAFSDVPRDAWYVKHICRARDGWLLTGYPDNTFRPATNINFSEAAKILANGYDIIDRTEHCGGKLCPDVDSPEHPWYERYVRALEGKNAIPLTIFSLDQPITRGEMAEIIFRLKADHADFPSRTYEELAQ